MKSIGLATGIDAAPMEADVDFDEHVEVAGRSLHRVRPLSSDAEVIDDDRDRRTIHQGDHPGGVRRVDRIRKANIADTLRREHLGLAELRAADANRTAVDLPLSDEG